jgi:AsmA-like C-terminal region/Protein of unknown function
MERNSSHDRFPRRLAMRRLPGQAARHAGVLLHRLAALVIAAAVLGCVAVGILAWRLSQGPLELPWLTHRIEKTLNQNLTVGHITIGSVALAWEGFRLGADRPLDLQVNGFTFAQAAHANGPNRQILAIPRAELSVSFHALLFGRIIPRALELDRPRISLVRAANGSFLWEPGAAAPAPEAAVVEADVATDVGPLLALLKELAKPAASDRSATRVGLFSQVHQLRIHDAALTVVDRQLDATWQAPQVEIDLTRGAKGGVDGTASASLALGDQHARLTATGTLPEGKGPIRLRLRLTPVTPAAIARLVPHAAALSAIDAPVGGEADVQLDDTMRPVALHLALRAGVGDIHVADGTLPITGATAVADATADHLDVRSLRLTVPGHSNGAGSTLLATGWVDRGADHLTGSLTLDLDRVAFVDLPHMWPVGVGRGARAWVTENITAGVAHDVHVEVGVVADPDLSDVTLTRATGTMLGDGLVVHWLRPVPPIEDGSAVLNILDPDTLEIVVRSGRQQPEPGHTLADAQGLLLRGGRMRVTGIMQHDQFATIEAQVAGPLPDALALLRDPRLRLLSRHPLPLNNPAGQVAGTLSVSLPLENRLSMDQVAIRAHAHLDDVHLGNIVAGHDLDHGVIDLNATDDGLTLGGTADLSGIPASLKVAMDFRAGGQDQVLQRVSVSARPSTQQLAAAGLNVSDVVDGTVGLDATLTELRDGNGALAVTADLSPATITVSPLDWHKPAGAAMAASGRLLLSHDRLTGIEDIQVGGDDVTAAGSVDCTGGKPTLVRIDRLVLGRTEAQGSVRLPAAEGDPLAISLSGRTLDLSARLAHHTAPHPPPPKPTPPSGPHWTLDARFDHAIMAGDHQITALAVQMDSDGGLTRRLDLDGMTGPKAPFHMRISSTGGKRTLDATAANAGELLAALDLITRMQGGQLTVTGSYDDTTADHALDGTAEIADFRMRDAPILGRLLQAMTLYGLVELARGPGLGFSRLVAPFRLTADSLTLKGARAFSSSLGLTVRGTIDLDRQLVTLDGTIVPAYFFNALLGNIPFVGRLFSPEPGGGLFAASYAVRGSLDDPDVTVNPLSALTPGFLRGLFGLF